jgi:hypothetical protein
LEALELDQKALIRQPANKTHITYLPLRIYSIYFGLRH